MMLRAAESSSARGRRVMPVSRGRTTIARQVRRSPRGIDRAPCACGGTCPRCQGGGLHVPAIVHDVLRSPGRPLDPHTRAFMEPRFGHDFSAVRIHTDTKAADSARAVDASAYTVGHDVVFGTGEYAPDLSQGRELLAHELAHVVQQGSAISGAPLSVEDNSTLESEANQVAQRVQGGNSAHLQSRSLSPATGLLRQPRRRAPHPAAPTVGTRFTHPPGSTSAYRTIRGEFDGRDFKLFGGSTLLMQVPASSGRPVAVRSADARACGGSTSESYNNNPLYVGIRDYGPIPEGTYSFRATQLATFDPFEQARFTAGGEFTDPFGAPMHGGDWGAGRVRLNPVGRLVRGPCGNTRSRRDFFLHGGSLGGSSGCIDIGNSGIRTLLSHLAGYRSTIRVVVNYRYPAPTIGLAGRVMGGAVYPGERNPTIWDRARGAWEQLTGGGDED